ncbi:hypothetical protein HO173_011456 [Letharia columbiana]|uniref:Uncharacterized protein n=1 Tax=Letharia columbiana TaxID=112416 RepID=A0A8H6FJ88_9LECA|nr:uncharacterized protein HO173_011456 [Letharia columbiana]KAF6229601.1 hypothetical protein HO173_011456 [Letharia columbiana]
MSAKHQPRKGLTPQDLQGPSNSKGVADELLARKEHERGRKRKADDEHMNGSRKRSRSTSSYSSNSVSTISTNLSRSLSPKLAGLRHTGQSQVFSNLEVDRKRRRSRSSSISYTSDSSHGSRRKDHPQGLGGDGYDRKGPIDRDAGRPLGLERRQREHRMSRSMSYGSHSSTNKRRKKSSLSGTRGKRRRHSSRSPVDRGRDRDLNSNRGSRRTRSPSESRDRSEVIRNRKSMTPGLPARQTLRQDTVSQRPDHHPNVDGRQSYSNDNDRYGSSARDRNENIRGTRPPPNAPPQKKERSLSPFSKRVRLTLAMNVGN